MAQSLTFGTSHLPKSAEGLAECGHASDELDRINAFSERWMRCQPVIRAYLSSFIPDPGMLDDCVQEIAIVAWRKGPLGVDHSVFQGHCLACARRIGLAALRRKGRDRLQFLSPDVAQVLADTVALRQSQPLISSPERVEALQHCLSQLKPDQRELIDLRYKGSGMESLPEEAKRLGKPVDALYKRLERLRDLLRKCVARQTERG